MKPVDLLVVGAGAAGTAAAWWAAKAGVETLLLDDRPSATELTSGALDLVPWDSAAAQPLPAQAVREFAGALGVWSVPEQMCWVASWDGIVRPTRGIDEALLDLGPLRGTRIGVPAVEQGGYSGVLLCRALNEAEWARASGTHFLSVPVPVHQRPEEQRYGDYDFAALHDVSARAAWLAQTLTEAGRALDAWLLGPWLGVMPGTARRVRALLDCPVGETLSPPGGPVGARFGAARDPLLAQAGVHRVGGRVSRLSPSSRGWEVSFRRTDAAGSAASGRGIAGGSVVEAKAVVLALGGLLGGSLRLAGATATSQGGFTLSVAGPIPLAFRGQRVEGLSALHGPDLTRWGKQALLDVGIAVEGTRVTGCSRLFAAGDCVAARPRTILEAVRAGIAAARAALDCARGG